MKNTYLKYIETAEVLNEGPPSGDARLQHVSVVAVVDQNGDEWFPDSSVPIGIVTESYYDPANVYKWGETVKATTATFVGDEDDQPLNIWARWQYRLNGESGFTDAERYGGLDNKPINIYGVIPANTAQLKFFTSAKEQGDTPETSEFASSVLSVQDVIQPSVTIENTTGSPVTAQSGVRTKIEVRITTNYTPEYFWQFQDPDGSYRNASDSNLDKYYPNSSFTLFDGFQTPSFSMTWLLGSPAPTKFRCRVRDVHSEDGFVQDFTPVVTINYV